MTFIGAVVAAALLIVTASITGAGPAAAGDPRWVPPDDTVVHIRGTASDGFTVGRYGGSIAYLPTRSEARSECLEYHQRLRRVRCWTQVRTWYRDLGDLKRSLRLVRQQARRR
jgi:hypothetical protein